MKKTHHTPGPWKLSAPGNKITGDGITIAHVYGHTPEKRYATDKTSTAEDRANARLIAAAPDLLAALQEMIADADTLNAPYRNEAICERARAAIAKATGEGVA